MCFAALCSNLINQQSPSDKGLFCVPFTSCTLVLVCLPFYLPARLISSLAASLSTHSTSLLPSHLKVCLLNRQPPSLQYSLPNSPLVSLTDDQTSTTFCLTGGCPIKSECQPACLPACCSHKDVGMRDQSH